MKVVFVEIERCIACLSCQRVCSFHRSEIHRGDAANIFVHVDMDRRQIITATCRQCEDALCMRICPAEALTRNPETHAVVVDKDRCIGCGLCVTVCPFGSVQLDGERRVATKCDLCGGDPRCVQVCMAKALHFGSISELSMLKRKRGDLKMSVRAVPLEKDFDHEGKDDH